MIDTPERRPPRDRIRVYCDSGTHWKRRRIVGLLERRRGVWVNASSTPCSIEMDHLRADEVTMRDDHILSEFPASLDRRRFRLWCPWCGDNSAVVVRGERLDSILDEIRDTPGTDILLAWLAARVASNN